MDKTKGFTLIELLIGIVILMLVISAVYASYNIGLRTYRKIEQESYINQNARQAWRVISRDLRCAFISASNKDINFIGEHDQQGEDTSDKVSFFTNLSDAEPNNCGLEKVSYYIETDPKSEHTGLIKENIGFPISMDNQITGQKQEIAPLVKSFKLRYFNGIEWMDKWGIDDANLITSQANTLPLAVEIKVTLTNEDKSERVVTTIVPILSN